ncbi:MAG: HRDC domain-containing protein [Deltaproteobacteria bacterium]|nr:HRDC domain-containing protein [Deltaproteobacteria bacterium]
MTEPAAPAEPETTPEVLPVPENLEDKGYRYVTTPEGLADCVADLEGTKVLAADIEGDSFFSYREKTCLLQMTGDSGFDWVIDPLALPDMEALRPVMEDRSVVKIFHGADYDVVSLKRDHGFSIGPIFDTMISAQATGHERFGLSDLVKRYFGDVLQKKYQRHDWSRRPLLTEHLEYARLDSHYLPRLREILLEQAEAGDRVEMLEEEFELLEKREWTGRPFNPDDCLKVKGSNKLDEEQKRVLRALFVARDAIAKRKDRPAFKVWGNDALLKLARAMPTSRDELTEGLGPKNHIVRRYADDVLRAIAAGRKDTSRIPGKKVVEKRTKNLEVPPYLREDEPLFNYLKKWRNSRANGAKLSPSMIVNNTVLKHVAALKPTTTDELEKIDDMRRWQRKDYGAELVERVASFVASKPAPSEGGEGTSNRRRRRRRRRRGPGDGSAGEAEAPPPSPSPSD